MDNDDREAAHKAALFMLDTFRSVIANRYDLTITSATGQKIKFRPNMPATDLHRDISGLLDDAAGKGQNIIIRPRGPGIQFIQLDDLKAVSIERIEEHAFLTLETSPGNFQAWIAIPVNDKEDEDFSRRLRKGAGADPSASGATRIAGSYNFKPKYAPEFPQVQIAASNPRHITTREQLVTAGLVADREKAPAPFPARVAPRRNSGEHRRAWPSYQKCIEGAPLNHAQTGPDVSKADFMFCLLAIDWGYSEEATATRLMEESTKAQENGEKYATLTASSAAQAVKRNRSR